MAKGKVKQQPRKPEKPAPPAASIVPQVERPQSTHLNGGVSAWRDFVITLLVLLAGAATAFVWLYQPPADPQMGYYQTGVVWAVAFIGILGRFQARRTVGRLKAQLAYEELTSARLMPEITEQQSGLGMRQASAWLVAVLGIAATVAIWQTGTIERLVNGGVSILVVGSTVSVMVALAVAANSINRLKVRRLSRDFRLALKSERLALETLGSLDVLISACLPSGERTRFNEAFLRFVGKTSAQMQGHGWLEVVHPEDRQGAVDAVAKNPANNRSREYDICIRNRAGDYVWLHETLVPRFNDKGELIEYIGTAIDITRRVENEAALDKQIGDLKADAEKAQVEVAAVKSELAEAKGELSKTKVARSRFETSLAESRDEVKSLRDAVERAEATVAATQADAAERIEQAQAEARSRVKEADEAAEARIGEVEQGAEERIRKVEETAEVRLGKLEESLRGSKQELQQSALENKKLTRAFEKLQEEIGQLKVQESDMREQVARHIKETREAKEEAVEAQKNEAQLRAKSDRLNHRCEELAAQVASKQSALTAAQNQADAAGVAAAAEVQRRLHEVSADALASQLKKQLDGMQRVVTELAATTMGGPVQDAAQNTAAAVRAMSELVNNALGGGKAAPPPARSAAQASFDLRRSAQGVRDLVAPAAEAKGVEVRVEVAPKVPALVYGDDMELRTALMGLTDAALHLVSDGTLILRLSEDVNTSAHSTIRCELLHASARIRSDALEDTFAIKSTDRSMPDAARQPVQHQAAKAWRIIRALQGQHGFMLPETGGFSLWFTFTLGRPGASGSLRPAPGTTLRPAAPQTLRPAPTSPPRQAPLRQAPASPATISAAPASAAAFNPAPTAAPVGGANGDNGSPRPRMPTELLSCNLGEVVELGTDSMRIHSTKPPKDKEVKITFNGVDLDTEFRGEVTWCKKLSGRKHDVGVKLVGLTQSEQQWMLRQAMQHRKVTTMMPEPG